MADKHERPFDIVLWGATGFTGNLVAEYMAEHSGQNIEWALAGRNREKLERLNAELPGPDRPILVGDALERSSLDDIAEQTSVICSTVGPYAKYGDNLVAACVDAGTDYCDLTGEIHWVRKMIEVHQRRAVEENVRIVHSCGFDSIPSDIGTFTLQNAARKRFGSTCESVQLYVEYASGGFSGGTVASMIEAIEAAKNDSNVEKILQDPLSLTSKFGSQRQPVHSQSGIRWDEVSDSWTAPFIMALMNEKIVHRTNDLLGDKYGSDFEYRESIRVGKGLGSWAKAATLTAGTGLFAGSLRFAPTKSFMESFILPEPGEGPAREDIEAGGFEISLIGTGAGKDGPFELRAGVRGNRDPGYGSTSVMLAESAMLLAETAGGDSTPGLAGGVLTPASAFETALNPRLQRGGIQIELSD